MSGIERINQESDMSEASYKYNIGFQEMVDFYQKASPKVVQQMENLIKKDSWHGFKRLIKKVLGVDLKG